LVSFSIGASPSSTKDDLLKKILNRAKENSEKSLEFGFYQITNTKKMNDGKLASEEVKEYKLIWLNGQPYLELIKKDGKDLDKSEKKKEQDRKAKFVKTLNKKDDDDDEDGDDITLDDLYVKYDFQELPADNIGQYVFSFKPKSDKLVERSRIERVVNHVAGKFWADHDFQIVRAEATLMDNVKFGLGIIGNIQTLQAEYEQTPYQGVLMPAKFMIHFKATFAMIKTEERQIQATYTKYYRRPVQ
jgi:hypothetical protein